MAAKTKAKTVAKKPVGGKVSAKSFNKGVKKSAVTGPKAGGKVGAKASVVPPVAVTGVGKEMLREVRAVEPRVPSLPASVPPVSLRQMMRVGVDGRDLLWLVFGYIWRSWLLALVWGGLMMLLAYLVVNEVPFTVGSELDEFGNTIGWPLWMTVLDFGGSIALGMVLSYWLMAAPKMAGGIELAATLQPASWFGQTPVRQAVRLWWSFTWRSLLWGLLGIILGIVGMFLNGLIGLSFAALADVLDMVLLAAGVVWFALFVPWVVWRQLLLRRTFGWGVIELRRVGG